MLRVILGVAQVAKGGRCKTEFRKRKGPQRLSCASAHLTRPIPHATACASVELAKVGN